MNQLLITSDQQHYLTLGVLNPEIKTPNLDKLAASGMLFERAYCPNPTCTPTRATIITGQYPSQHGAWTLGTKLPESALTIGDLFHKAGYATGLIGKAHFQPLYGTEEFPSLEAYPVLQDLTFWKHYKDPFYGFRHVELARNHTDESHVGQHYALWMEEKGLKNWRDHFSKPTGNVNPQYGAWTLPEEYHYNTWITERSLAFMREQKQNDKPFFLWASYFDPHPSYCVPEPWASMYDPDSLTLPAGAEKEHQNNPSHFQKTQEEKPDFSGYAEQGGNGCHGFHSHLRSEAAKRKDMALYYGMVSMLDHYIGKLLDGLADMGLVEETLVVFTTDHGHFFGQHNLVAKGAFHFEDMIRIPFIARWPGKTPAGSRCSSLISLVDLAQTFLAAAGIPAPRQMTGIDQGGVIRGEEKRARDWILVENHHQPTTLYAKTYVEDRYKITYYQNTDEGELFDLQKDPGEFNNLWSQPQAQGLKAELLLKSHQAVMSAEPMWMPRTAGA